MAVFVPGRVAPDAFSDILDPALRNERIRQDIENQKRIYEYQQMAKEFDDWDKSRYWSKFPSNDFYDKNLAAMQYGRKGSFVGAVPSIGAGLETLGITPEGKLTFGRHGSNAVMPLRGISPSSKRMFRTDANGTPIPLSDDEIVLAEKAKGETERQAAIDAATPVAEAPKGASENTNESANETPWYDFLKHPQNTPYEQEQMRNQAIMRDAAIAAAMNKPIIYPEADTLSEPMAKLAGQQNSLAHSAMGQLTSRQGMAADFYKMGSNLVNSYAQNAYAAQLKANQTYNAAVQANENAKVVRERVESLYGPNGSEALKYTEFVRKGNEEEARKIAAQRDLMVQQAEMLENQAQKYLEDANNLVGKANVFKGSANKVSKDIELGYDFGGDLPLYEGFNATQKTPYATQAETLNSNTYDIAGNAPSPNGEGPAIDVNIANQPRNYGLKFDPKTGKVYRPTTSEKPKADVTAETSDLDEIQKKIAKNHLGKDVKIANWANWAATQDLSSVPQSQKRREAWLVGNADIATDITKVPQDLHKYADWARTVANGGEDRFGAAARIIKTSPKLNLPLFEGLDKYENEIHKKGYSAKGELGALSMLYDKAKAGIGLTLPEIKQMESTLRTLFKSKNVQGQELPLFQNNGFSLKYAPKKNPYNNVQMRDSESGQPLFILDLEHFK